MTFRVLIVDDEALARDAISIRLQAFNDFEICGQADNGKDAVLLVDTIKPDVIFLDIEMPECNGIEAAKLISQNSESLIVFVSAYQHYALQAFRVNAIDYLLKPIDDEQFAEMITKLKTRLQQKSSTLTNQKLLDLLQQFKSQRPLDKPQYLQRLSLKDRNETIFVNVIDIESIESVKDYLCIKVKNHTYIYRCTMKQIHKLLNPDEFIRTHRSHLVNKKYIRGYRTLESTAEVTMLSGDSHPISRRYKSQTLAAIQDT